MRKYILLFILTCLHIATRGQTIGDVDLSVLPQPTKAEKLQYWFDDDIGSLSSMQHIGGKQTIDVSSLLAGLHTIHYQIVDNKGKVAVPYSAMFMKLAQYNFETASGLRYWFDDDEKSAKKTSVQNGVSTIDVSAINDGLHTLHFQILDSHNSPSYIASAFFMKIGKSLGGETLRAERLMYWYDDEEKIVQASLNAGMNMLDASHLTEGLHTLHYQILCNNGALTEARSAFFFRVNYDANSSKAKEMRYWYDDQTKALTTEINNGVQMLDVSDLVAGLHIVHYQLVDESGKLGVPASTMFFKVDAMPELAQAKTQRYWFDDDHDDMHECAVTNGIQSLDVKGLSTGMHTLHYQLVDGAGNVTVPYSNIFMKMSEFESVDGKNAIIRYRYWLNDGSDMKTVELQKPSNPFQLISLLSMQKTPIRSSSFHFETKSGEPTIYANNDFHIRFEDAAGYWADDARSFVDYSVSEKVTDVAQLKSTQTFTRPDENGIKWFKFDAAPGDTIAFKTSQATSVQVFAPSGNEIFSASGDKSVKYGGTHTWEAGIYYVAIHDVTGSQQNITLDYMHMDKYDVVDQNVRVVGNGGCSTITFQGNGFRDLYAVDLKDSKGNIIQSIDIGHESDATTTVTYDFTGTKPGKYNAVFHFTEDDKTFADNITVEEAKEIELALRVDYPSTFLRGTTADFVIQIENKGNVMAYDVPIELQVSSGSCFDNITSVRFYSDDKEINLLSIDLEEKDSMDMEVVSLVERMIANQNGLHNFVVVKRNDATEVGISHLLVTVPPLGKEEIKVSIRSSDAITLQALISSDWTAFGTTSSPESMAHKAKSIGGLCCYKERIQCTVSAICDIGGLFPAVGCLSGAIDLGTYTVAEFGCAGGTNISEKIRNLKNSISKSTASNKILGAALGCAAGAVGKALKVLKDKLKNVNALKNAAKEALEQARKARDDAYELYLKYRNKSNAALEAGNYDDMKIFGDMADDYYEDYKKLDANRVHFEGRVADLEKDAASLEGQILQEQSKSDQLDHIGNSAKALFTENDCVKSYTNPPPNCPPTPQNGGGTSTPVNSFDPNDIYGYIAPSGTKFVGKDVVTLPYRIEFENDTTFATASAHTVVVKDTLDAKVFDLSSYQPTSIKIGDKDVQLKGDKTFVTTVDMRPAINAITQVKGLYDEKKGIATWQFTSLDPMTMEPTNDIMQGFLPINFDGSGIGEVAYNINRKARLSDGTAISNKASIVFDSNDAIETPTWTNIIDAIPPVSEVSILEQMNDSIVRVHFDGYDNRSDIWKYSLYVQYGEGSTWNEVAEMDSAYYDFRFYEDIDYGFCVLATDSAGNVEQKIIQREYMFLNGKTEKIDAITAPVDKKRIAVTKAYDLSGRVVQEEGYRGIIIKNRKKIQKR